MPHRPTPRSATTCTTACALALGALLLAPAQAADKKPAKAGGSAEAAADRANCQKHHPQQDLAACMLEARNARADERRGLLGNGEAALPANATRRCDPLPAADKADCIARVRGAGSASGSVEGGGVIRETQTTVPAQ